MRRIVTNLALLAAAVVVGALLVEVGLRLAGFAYPIPYRVDRELGKVGRPGAFGVWTWEGHGRFTFNEHGYRDRPRSVDKPPGTFRIAVLGDSFTESLQVDDAETFTRKLEVALNECAGRPVEVLNFGIGSYSQANQLLTLRRVAGRFVPDLVLVVVYPSNDAPDNLPANAPRLIVYHPDADGHLTLDARAAEQAWARPWVRRAKHALLTLSDYSRLVQSMLWFSDHGLTALRPGTPANPIVAVEGTPRRMTADESRVMRLLLTAIGREAEARGAAFWLAMVPDAADVLPASHPGRTAVAGREGVFSDAAMLIADVARQHAWGTIDLTTAMRRHAEETGDRFGFVEGGHWNATGHAVAADAMAENLCPAIRDRK